MTNKMNENVKEFLGTAISTNKVNVQYFKDNEKNLAFDGENALAWQFIILKSFDKDFNNLLPLANYLLDNNYCEVDKNMLQFAALNGFKVEDGMNRMQKPLDEINQFTQDCGFSEKMIIKNEPAENIISLAKKIINHSNDDDFNEVKQIFIKANIDISNSNLLNKPNIKKLKV